MSTTIEAKGDYSQKAEIGHWVLSHHTGSFDLTKALGTQGWHQSFGPAVLTETLDEGEAVVSLSAFGFSKELFRGELPKGQEIPFKIELDSGNYVRGTLTVK